MEYNDNLLCPELYEKMAKEYSLAIQKKSQDITNKNISKLFPLFDTINNNILYLNNLTSLSIKNKQHLKDINSTFSNIKNLVVDFNFSNTKPKLNYCECLTNSIWACTTCLKELCLNCYYTKPTIKTIDWLASIIENLSCMYGRCRYRSE
ncbi:MAG: hypothetical protein J6Q51_03870 [Clostridia bacterium]|nr:hypothetical protein [Clostridia bacterium]